MSELSYTIDINEHSHFRYETPSHLFRVICNKSNNIIFTNCTFWCNKLRWNYMNIFRPLMIKTSKIEFLISLMMVSSTCNEVKLNALPLKVNWVNPRLCCNTKNHIADLLIMHLTFLKVLPIFITMILWFHYETCWNFHTSKETGNFMWKLAYTHNKGNNNTLICNTRPFTFTRSNYETWLHVVWNAVLHICFLETCRIDQFIFDRLCDTLM